VEAGAVVTTAGAARNSLGRELREAGPIALRAGHYLALRADWLGPAERADLVRFGDHVPPLEWSAIAPQLSRALGADPADAFDSVEPRAQWSNAITQTHRARLRDGTPVTVKIVRPGATEQIARAEPWLRSELPALLHRAGAVDDPGTAAADVGAWLRGQGDLSLEAANLARMRDVVGDSTWGRVPALVPELSGARVLVTEDLGGVRVGDIGARWAGAQPSARIDRRRLARVPVLVLLRQALRYRLFCVDWHPDTVLALPEDRITLADWSLVAELDADLALQLQSYLTAVFDGDVELVLSPPGAGSWVDGGDPLAFRRDLTAYIRGQASARPSTPGAQQQALLEEILRLSATHGIGLPLGERLLLDALLCAQMTALAADPEVDCGDVARRSLAATRAGAKFRHLGPDQTAELLSELTTLAADLPGQVHDVLADLADGSFSLNVWVSEAAQAERNRNRRARLLAAAIVAVGLALLLSARHLPRVGGVSVAWVIGAALAVTYAWLAIEWRRLR
jgi:ubiquinone biosynthesis protein